MSKHYSILTLAVVCSLSACGFDGQPLFNPSNEHEIKVGGGGSDTEALSVQVREKLRNNGQTSLARIRVSTPNPDTIRLSGSVDNDGVRHEAERLAYQVEGVRFVVNTLNVTQ